MRPEINSDKTVQIRRHGILRGNFNSTQTGSYKCKGKGKDLVVDEALSEQFSLTITSVFNFMAHICKIKTF